MEITHGMVRLLTALLEKREKYWREIRALFEQVVLMIDVQEAFQRPASSLPGGGPSTSSEHRERASAGTSSAVPKEPKNDSDK